MKKMNIKEAALRAGATYLKPWQELIIRKWREAESSGKREALLAVLPTGMGKSLCYMIPALMTDDTVLIIYPLLSLLNDQTRRFDEAGIKSVALTGGLGRKEREKRLDEVRSGRANVILMTAEMALYLAEAGKFSSLSLSLLVLDEAHTILEWGSAFRESYKRIGELISFLSPRQVFAFSATVNKENEDYILTKVIPAEYSKDVVRESSDRSNIIYHRIRSFNPREDVRVLLKDASLRPALIFCESRELTERLSEFLSSDYDTKCYHAGQDKGIRREEEEWFSSSKDGVLVATSAYGMGVDKGNIRSVIHLSLPRTASSFLQGSGRAGRDGRESHSYVLYSSSEKGEMIEVFRGEKCIRHSLLSLMGEIEGENESGCAACDVCLGIKREAAGEKEIKSYLRFHPLIKIDDLSNELVTENLFLRRKRLPKWKKEEVREAIETLIQEKSIGKIGPFLYLKSQKK